MKPNKDPVKAHAERLIDKLYNTFTEKKELQINEQTAKEICKKHALIFIDELLTEQIYSIRFKYFDKLRTEIKLYDR